eukprot:11709275-Ditylum_brightwellii.AAC.1
MSKWITQQRHKELKMNKPTHLNSTRLMALPSKCKVATKLDKVLLDHIEGKKVIHYWTQYFVQPADLLDQIDWLALSLARSKTNFHFRKWATKWAAEKIPT